MKPDPIKIVRFFFYLLAGLWLMLGIGYIVRSQGRVFDWIVSGLMFANIFLFILLGANITKRPVFWLAVIVLIVYALLTIFDQFGLADLIALILFTSPLVIMLIKRNEFFASASHPKGETYPLD